VLSLSKIEGYLTVLKTLDNWDEYLMTNSNLPGPRGNLELIYAVAATGREVFFKRFIDADNPSADGNTPEDFLTMCAVVGLGRLVAEGKTPYLRTLRKYASDRRWRLRESVAMALQLFGDRDMAGLLVEMEGWSKGTEFEKRAAAAGLCEPRLLKEPEDASKVLDILDGITASVIDIPDRKGEGFVALRKGLGYCWSVAVVACPVKGKSLMEKWLAVQHKDVRQIMKDNLLKNRLARMDAQWTTKQLARLAGMK
jgi:hypothetical protein